jgi:hypothetical protein
MCLGVAYKSYRSALGHPTTFYQRPVQNCITRTLTPLILLMQPVGSLWAWAYLVLVLLAHSCGRTELPV